MNPIDPLSYPIGKYTTPVEITEGHMNAWIDIIETFPAKLEKAVRWLSSAQLDTPYRPGGWSIRQLVHHIADSHMNAYVRLKLGLTEDNPNIKPYDQDAWAKLPDSKLLVEISLGIITGVHQRWVTILKSVEDWERTVYHPEQLATMTLDDLTGQYAWHCEHHLAHVLKLIEREGW